MKPKRFFMETTSISAQQSAAAIRAELVSAGVNKIQEQYAPSTGSIVGLTFSMLTGSGDMPFCLPVRVEPIFTTLQARRRYKRESHAADDRRQAERIAWRQLYRWVQAQVALIRIGMVSVDEVFLPYLTNGQQTLYEIAQKRGLLKMLPGPKGATVEQ